MRPLIAGNWKMNGLSAQLAEIATLARTITDERARGDVLVCPPFTLVRAAIEVCEGRVAIGAQDCHAMASGAFTGDVSAEMLRDAGAIAVIVGHSERRQQHGETDTMVAGKVRAAWRAGLLPILCIGETAAQHDAGQAREIVGAQLDVCLPPGATGQTLAVAYEPVWAIGSGRTPATDEIVQMHALIRARLERVVGAESFAVRILYGGSVKPANASAILALPNVNGVLVGGASLVAGEFVEIIRAVPSVR